MVICLLDLPRECLLTIHKFLENSDICLLMQTCKQMRNIQTQLVEWALIERKSLPRHILKFCIDRSCIHNDKDNDKDNHNRRCFFERNYGEVWSDLARRLQQTNKQFLLVDVLDRKQFKIRIYTSFPYIAYTKNIENIENNTYMYYCKMIKIFSENYEDTYSGYNQTYTDSFNILCKLSTEITHIYHRVIYLVLEKTSDIIIQQALLIDNLEMRTCWLNFFRNYCGSIKRYISYFFRILNGIEETLATSDPVIQISKNKLPWELLDLAASNRGLDLRDIFGDDYKV